MIKLRTSLSRLSGFTLLTFFVFLASPLSVAQPAQYQKSLADSLETLPSKIKNIRPSIVEILVDGKRSGSGFVVSSDGYILTAIHVVGEPHITSAQKIAIKYKVNIEAVFSDGTKSKAEPVENPQEEFCFYDMALLKVDRQTTPLKLATGDAAQNGALVYLMGFPLDLPEAVTYAGTIASKYSLTAGTLRGISIPKKMIQVEAPIAKGFSGSPLIDYKTDTVVGVVEIKIGGINENLQEIARNINEGSKHGSVRMMGVDPNAALLQLIGVLDAYLSAGSGSAVSIEHIAAFVQEKKAQKK
jgi:S1-C subfamily serine protease